LTLNQSKGFTLIEVVASLVLISTFFVAILGVFQAGMRINQVNQERIIAYNLMQRKLEEIKTYDFIVNVDDLAGSPFASFPGYILKVRQVVPHAGNPMLKKVVVDIEWASYAGGNSSDSITFLIADQS
jgi:prepilin-type N-terminal cleavage/methylation domain-containing protein